MPRRLTRPDESPLRATLTLLARLVSDLFNTRPRGLAYLVRGANGHRISLALRLNYLLRDLYSAVRRPAARLTVTGGVVALALVVASAMVMQQLLIDDERPVVALEATSSDPSDIETPTEMLFERPKLALSLPQEPDTLGRQLEQIMPAAGNAAGRWREHAVPVTVDTSRPVITLVIDDVGMRRQNFDDLIALPAPLTLALLPYADGIARQAKVALGAGHELLAHVPMEPDEMHSELGEHPLLINQDPDTFRSELTWNLRQFDGYVGVSNHMGSRLTAQPRSLALLMGEMRRQGLGFFDSRTTPRTLAIDYARRFQVPHAERQIFIDNERETAAIVRQLQKVEAQALDEGAAIAIAHPYPVTVKALSRWLPHVQARGFQLVPISWHFARSEAALKPRS